MRGKFMEDCVFCNIAQKTVPAKIVAENNEMLVIHDILPQAPVHVLIMTKQHLASLNDASAEVAGQMVAMGREVAARLGVGETGYRLMFNVGKQGGQIVRHLHLHLLGGAQLA